MLHGGPGLTDYLPLLSDEVADWRWISYQQRGLPPSVSAGPYTLEQHVSDAIAVLDELGVDRAVVLGHSWGGYLAMQLAAARPDRVSGLVIVDPLGAVGDGGVAEMGNQLADRLAAAAVDEHAQVQARLSTPDRSDEDFRRSLELLWPGYYADPATAPAMPDFIACSIDSYLGGFASVADQIAAGFAERLRTVQVPAVFVLGERSPMPLSQGEQTAALLPHSEVQIVPEAGHLPWHEQPGCIAQALARIQTLIAADAN